jgi:hypothetical protein
MKAKKVYNFLNESYDTDKDFIILIKDIKNMLIDAIKTNKIDINEPPWYNEGRNSIIVTTKQLLEEAKAKSNKDDSLFYIFNEKKFKHIKKYLNWEYPLQVGFDPINIDDIYGAYHNENKVVVSISNTYELELCNDLKSNKYDHIFRHELRHAYDDFISNHKYTPKHYKSIKNDTTKSYVRQDLEISAFFTQMNKNIVYKKTKDFTIIKSYKDLIYELKEEPFYYYLTPKQKRNTIRRLMQYYIKIKEDIPKNINIKTRTN